MRTYLELIKEMDLENINYTPKINKKFAFNKQSRSTKNY